MELKKTTMKAAVWYGHRDIRIEERPLPEAAAGEVLVAVAWAGICGTDRHEYLGPTFIPVQKPHRLTGKKAPLILGHEFSGRIAALGPGVRGWQRGDRVSANGSLSCGVCGMCRAGRYNVCEKLGFIGVSRDGAFAEYVAVEAPRLFKVPDRLSLRTAVLAEPIACGLHAARLLGELRGTRVLIVGPGIIGLSCFFAVQGAGAAQVLVAGIGEERRLLVERRGGIYVDTAKEDLTALLLHRFGGPADISFECVGHQSALDTAAGLLKSGGALMVMGVYEAPPRFPMNDFQEGERRLYTSQAHLDEIAPALEQLAAGRIDGEALITREITLDTLVRDGFEELAANPGAHIKVLINIGEEDRPL